MFVWCGGSLALLHVYVANWCCLGYGVADCVELLIVVVRRCWLRLFFVVVLCRWLLLFQCVVVRCRWMCSLVRCCLSRFGVALLLRICYCVLLCVVVGCCLCVGVGLWFVVIGVSGCSYAVCGCSLCADVCCNALLVC